MSDADSTAQVEYRPIPGFPGYRVGDDGSVWSEKSPGNWHRRGKWRRLKGKIDRYGYVQHTLSIQGKCKSVTAHRLVLLAFRGPCPNGMLSAHSNGNRSDNRADNLSWKTPAGNTADRFTHGTMSKKLTLVDVEAVISLLAAGNHTMDEIAAQFGVSRKAIATIAAGQSWRPVTNGEKQIVIGKYPKGEEKFSAKLTEDNVREIRATPNVRGVTKAFAERFGVACYTISLARKGIRWKHVT